MERRHRGLHQSGRGRTPSRRAVVITEEKSRPHSQGWGKMKRIQQRASPTPKHHLKESVSGDLWAFGWRRMKGLMFLCSAYLLGLPWTTPTPANVSVLVHLTTPSAECENEGPIIIKGGETDRFLSHLSSYSELRIRKRMFQRSKDRGPPLIEKWSGTQ